MKTWIERLMGVNFRTSLAGLVTTIAGLVAIYAALPDAARNDWKVWLPIILTAISKTFTDFQTKDRAVSGNSAVGFVVAAAPSEPPRFIDVVPPKPEP